VSTGGYAQAPAGARAHTVTLGQFPVPLGGPAGIALSVDHHYRIERPDPHGPYRVTTVAYYYGLDDTSGREILSYHWHPPEDDREDGIRYPHLHVGAGAVDATRLATVQQSENANWLRSDLASAHLITQRILLEDVIQLAVEQFKVPSIGDWVDKLAKSRERFAATGRWRTYAEWDEQRGRLGALPPSRSSRRQR
jgi:hypothetical protein